MRSLPRGQAQGRRGLPPALACQGGIETAVQHYAKAVALPPEIDTSITLQEVLGENYAKAGRWEEAIRSAEHALQIARSAGKNDLADRVNARLLRCLAQAASVR